MSRLSPRAKFIHEVYDILDMYVNPELPLEHLMGALVGKIMVGKIVTENANALYAYLESVGAAQVPGHYWEAILAHAAMLSNEVPLPSLAKWMADVRLFSQEALRTLYPQWEDGETLSEFTRRIVLAEQNDDE